MLQLKLASSALFWMMVGSTHAEMIEPVLVTG
jgi:hypothetical protein